MFIRLMKRHTDFQGIYSARYDEWTVKRSYLEINRQPSRLESEALPHHVLTFSGW